MILKKICLNLLEQQQFLKLRLYLHDFQSEIQFDRVEISPRCNAL